MKTAIYSFITKHSLIKEGDTIIIGLSGGPDSVFLLHMLYELRKELPITLIAAHLNHGWREDAHNDLLFCEHLCKTLEIPFESAHAHDLPVTAHNNGSLEDLGRTLRRSYFATLKEKYHATAIALGHHRDDQIETFFIRLTRGASLMGLGCMKPSHNGYIRPLLETSKKDIITYLADHAISYQIDSTNESPHFLRNRIRTLLPLFTQCDPRFTHNTLKAIAHLQDSHTEIQKITYEKYLRIVIFNDKIKSVDTLLLKKESLFFQKQIINQWLIDAQVQCTMSNGFFEEILRFLLNPRGGEHIIGTSWKVVKKHNRAHIKNV
jgi:tRNA(Ile)-lysidine synthase